MPPILVFASLNKGEFSIFNKIIIVCAHCSKCCDNLNAVFVFRMKY